MSNRYAVPRRVLALSAVLAMAALAAPPAGAQEPAAAPAKAPEKTSAERRAEDGLWARGTNWISFRAGYARAAGANAGDALGGYGVGYQHMMSKAWAFGASLQHDVLGHLGDSYEMSVPFTVEFTRHYKWQTPLRPYLGLGGGYYFHKYYRTGADYTGAPGAGYYVVAGTNLPLDDRHLLGVDARVSFVKGRDGVVNPVFGPEHSSETLWALKLNWAIGY